MPMPADMRGHCLAITSAMLADEIRALHLPGDVAGRVLSLVEQIERHARILSGGGVSFPAPMSAPPCSPSESNVVRLRPRNVRL